MTILKELIEIVYNKHNSIIKGRVAKEYSKGGITIYIYQTDAKMSIAGLNNNTNREVDLTAKKYIKLFECYNEIANISRDYKSKNIIVNFADEKTEVAAREVKKEIPKLITENIKCADVEFIEYLKSKFGENCINKTKNVIEQLDNIKSKRHNAGRKSKFSNKDIKEILNKRNAGATIKELAAEFRCGVATIHKLINEK